MVRRFPYERRDAGWVAAHTGIVFLLSCFAASDLALQDGFIALAPTAARSAETQEPSEATTFVDVQTGGERQFPFALRLVRTSADWYRQLSVAVVDPETARVLAEQDYPVLAGRAIDVGRPSADAPPLYRIEMLEVLDRSRTTRVGFRPGTASGLTALQLFPLGAESKADTWLTDQDPPTGIPGARLRFVVARDDGDVTRWTSPRIDPETGAAGFVRIVAGGADLVRMPATPGAKADFDHEGKTWHAAVVDAALDLRTALAERSKPAAERTPIERQIPDIEGATLSLVTDGIEPQRASAFGGDFADLANGQMANPVLKKQGFTFELDADVPVEVRIVAMPDGTLAAVTEDRGSVSKPQTLKKGDVVAFPGAASSGAHVGDLVRDAELDVDVSALPDETDADYMRNGLAGRNEQIGQPAVKLRITEPSAAGGAATHETWLLGGDPWLKDVPILETRDRRLRLALTNASESMYRSAVQAIDAAGNVLGEHVVRVNSPFRVGGYEFYQNQFHRPDQGGPVTVFRVKHDPFIPFIYAGFVLVAAGVIVLLWFPGQRAFKLHAHLARLPEDGGAA
jgi:hypothetical protein